MEDQAKIRQHFINNYTLDFFNTKSKCKLQAKPDSKL